MPVIPVLRQEDLEFELSLGYIVNSRPALAEPLLAREVLTKKKKKKKKKNPKPINLIICIWRKLRCQYFHAVQDKNYIPEIFKR
jgi:hypothetical protein